MADRRMFMALDAATASWCGEALADWVRAGPDLDGGPVRCPVTSDDRDAVQRLDLSLRHLHAEPESHWCRDGGAEATAVVLSWPLPARGVALFVDGAPETLVLAVGRPAGAADLWRFHLEAPDPLTTRAAQLLALV